MKEQSYHHGNLREGLIEAGLKILREDGMENLSLRKAATMCGVSHAAPKTHFANKKEFEEAIKSHVAKEFADAMQKIVDDNKDPHKMIQEFGLSYIQYFIDHPDSFMLLLNQKDIEIRASKEHIYDSDYAAFQIFQTHATKLLLKSGVSEKYIPRRIISLWAIVTGLSALTVMHGFLFEGDWLAMTTSILTGYDNFS